MAVIRRLSLRARHAGAAGALLLSVLPSRILSAQLSSEGPRSTEVSYEQLVLKRDAGQFTFGDGKFYLLTSIAGRTMGAVFLGHGIFSFSPPTRIEQDRLARFQKTRTLEVPFSSVVLLFADSTVAELESKLTFGPGQPPSDRLKTARATACWCTRREPGCSTCSGS